AAASAPVRSGACWVTVPDSAVVDHGDDAPVPGEGPDHGEVEHDDHDGPDRVVGQPSEIRQDADRGDDDTQGAGPDRTGEQADSGEDRDDAHEDVDPSPGCDVELEDPCLGGDV